jgi:peptidoglycan hydrolase-like protein with peptidoglycan-binding domain
LSGGDEFLTRIGDDPLFIELPLNLGDNGDAVRQIQLPLQATGADIGSYGADGDFGEDTRLALEGFQYRAGLEITGSVGPHPSMPLRSGGRRRVR